jgi:hypothetical protein
MSLHLALQFFGEAVSKVAIGKGLNIAIEEG